MSAPPGARVPTGAPGHPAGDVGELTALLPAEARRCVAVQPARVPADKRPLYAPISQAPALPWTLSLQVSAYVRAELEGPSGRRESVEYVRFAQADPMRIRAELTRGDSRPLVWDDASPPIDEQGGPWPVCGDDFGCAAVGARFVDARTVQLSTPPVLAAYEPGGGSCLALLRQVPEAVEVAARSDALLGSTHIATESYLYGSEETLVRVLRHRFQDEAAAEQALLHAISGEEEAPSLASSLVDAERRRIGEWLELRSTVAFEELALGLADQERLREALHVDAGVRVTAAAPNESDADAVRAFVDANLAVLPTPHSDAQKQRIALLDDLLTRALRVHPDEDGLARRLFELRIAHAPAAALEVADQALGALHGEPAYWELSRRRALLALSAKRYRAELQKSFGLPARVAAQMAAEVSQKVAGAEDHERAEWAFLTARNLCQRAERAALQQQRVSAAPRLPLSELPRLLVYLARLSAEREQQPLGVHILARGLDSLPAGDGPSAWSEESKACGGPGRVLAAASFDDAQLLAQGALLARHFPAGELELLVSIDPLNASGKTEGASLRMQGQVVAGVLTLREVGKTLRDVRWPLVERYLLAPLSGLRGSLFPPDEWAVEASSSELALSMLASARSESAAVCANDGVVVRCRGSFADPRAAARALRRAAFAVLARETRALWSGAD